MKNNTAIILILLSLGLFYTFTNAQYQSVKELQSLANEYDNVLDNASATMELRDSLSVAYGSLPKAEVDRLNKVLPDNIDTVRLALDLDSMASRYGISIKSIRTVMGSNKDASHIVLPENESKYDSATITFSFISSYDNFKRLMADVEKSLRIMDVKSVSFQVGESGFNDYQVSVDTYWLK